MCNGVFLLLVVVCVVIVVVFVYVVFDMQFLVDKSGCFLCYSMYVKIVGFVFVDVVVKYKGDVDVLIRLVQKVCDGGKGMWGCILMFLYFNFKEDEVKQLVVWVLSLGFQVLMLFVRKEERVGIVWFFLFFMDGCVLWLCQLV